ncbi:unnamed protein product [Pleuronectes platessa]|uniref:Uncharacterized protein n=1 Tax=Pleuronectes platessa TaxID=8262 RepID=A0A9N7UTM9_PLEPL|nr:unnamed protein product [Pleuronectes platessa]
MSDEFQEYLETRLPSLRQTERKDTDASSRSKPREDPGLRGGIPASGDAPPARIQRGGRTLNPQECTLSGDASARLGQVQTVTKCPNCMRLALHHGQHMCRKWWSARDAWLGGPARLQARLMTSTPTNVGGREQSWSGEVVCQQEILDGTGREPTRGNNPNTRLGDNGAVEKPCKGGRAVDGNDA